MCEDTKCKITHLKSFRRAKKDGKPRNISSGKKNSSRSSKDGKHGNKCSGENSSKASKDEDPRNASSSQKYSSKSAHSKYKASFLEVKELVENIHLRLGKFQEELNQVKASLRMTPRSLATVGHQGHYLGHLMSYIECEKQDNHLIPFVALTETWLKSYVSDAQLQIPGYDITRCDRESRVGGGQSFNPSHLTTILS